MTILRNRWRTPDGTILESTHRHDFQTHLDADGTEYFVDGGKSYIRTGGDLAKLEDMCVTSESPFVDIRENFMWTSYGKNGDESAKTRALKDLDTDHIQAIIKTQTHLSDEILDLFKKELMLRLDV